MAFVWVLGIAGAAFVGGLAGGLLVLPVGLNLDDRLTWLLVFLVSGLGAALGATWAGSVLGQVQSAVRLSRVLAASEAAALLLWLERLSPAGAALAQMVETNLAYVGSSAVALAVVAVVAAGLSRTAQRNLRRLTWTTLGTFAVVVVVVPATIVVASLFGLVGA
jgi:hypothetical protein